MTVVPPPITLQRLFLLQSVTIDTLWEVILDDYNFFVGHRELNNYNNIESRLIYTTVRPHMKHIVLCLTFMDMVDLIN